MPILHDDNGTVAAYSVQQSIMLLLGAQPNFIGWVLAAGQQHPTISQGVSSRFGATGAKSSLRPIHRVFTWCYALRAQIGAA